MSSAQLQSESSPDANAIEPHYSASVPCSSPGDVRDATVYRIRLPVTVICIGTGVALTLIGDSGTLQHWALRWSLATAGLVTVILGAAVRLTSLASIGERKTRRLVTTGPYSLCRNPLYLGTLFIVLGFLGVWQSFPLTILVVPVILLYRNGVVPIEEKVLLKHHGNEFIAYCTRTPRWIPRLNGYVAEENLAVQSTGFRKEAEASLWWAGLATLSLWARHLAG